VLYDILKSLIRSGIAGTNMVSAYRTIVATELSIITTLHEEAGISFPECGVRDCNITIITIPLLFYFYILDLQYLQIASEDNDLKFPSKVNGQTDRYAERSIMKHQLVCILGNHWEYQ